MLPDWLPVFHNAYGDFDDGWYYNVAPTIVQGMFTMTIFPWIDCVILILTKKLFQLWDSPSACCERTFCCKKTSIKTTKETTIKSFVNLYAGDEVELHFKYAYVLYYAYTAFMYGLFIPEMFPLACFGIFNLYVSECLMLAYWHRKPPNYESKNNVAILRMLHYLPLLMFSFGYWALSNLQIF